MKFTLAMSLQNLRDPAKRCSLIFGQPMEPCPVCGGYQLGYQTPIRMSEPIEAGDGARDILRKYARSVKGGATPLEGPVFLWCKDCHHKGPAMDCSGRTSEEVGKDRAVATEVKRLWNTQPPPWRIFRLNDCDWWVAHSLEEAYADALPKHYGLRVSEPPTPEELQGFEGAEISEARELTVAEMHGLEFRGPDVEPVTGKPVIRSFRQELNRRIREEVIAVGLFASTEG